jgi:hypothetical protein
MTKHPAILATVIVLVGGAAFAQQQYDSLGSPTPAPQNASPKATGPNVPVPGPAISGKAETNDAASTTGSAIQAPPPANSVAKQPHHRGTAAPTDGGVTPSGPTGD